MFKTLAAILVLSVSAANAAPPAPITIVIHGGAGALERGRYSPEQEAAFKSKLAEALKSGYSVLESGGEAVDAVEAAILLMEDSPLFNAGKGAVFDAAGVNELDAAIMDGKNEQAGAVAGVTHVKNPIKLARAVMDHSRHVMMIGHGAEKFAKEQDIELVKRSYFFTEERWQAYKKAKNKEKAEKNNDARTSLNFDSKYGTVGAVALDRNGNIAAGTSTGGLTLKRYGRVGDSPIIGAGTYASNRSCGVSATGTGEYFIRFTIARDICAEVEFNGRTAGEAANKLIHETLANAGGDGGVIVLTPLGDYAFDFNTAGMFRGVKNDGIEMVAIYGDEN
ncbi:MAG: isoaspartyl peptidase/L-asparaginase [Parvularculaceae bacterium]